MAKAVVKPNEPEVKQEVQPEVVEVVKEVEPEVQPDILPDASDELKESEGTGEPLAEVSNESPIVGDIDAPDVDESEEEETEDDEEEEDDESDETLEDRISTLRAGGLVFRDMFVETFGQITAGLFDPILNMLNQEQQKIDTRNEPEVDIEAAIKANQEKANAELEKLYGKGK